jgi:hypothetical protein
MSGEVGTVAQTHVDTSGDATLDAAIKRFENLKTCSKDYWNFRKTLSQNGQYMYLEQNYEGMWLKQWPSRTIKENAALVDRSTYRKKNVMGG